MGMGKTSRTRGDSSFGGIFVGDQHPITYHNIEVFGDLGSGESSNSKREILTTS